MGDHVQDLPGISDQISYDQLAQNLLAGNSFSFDQDWWPATRAGEPTAHWSYLMTLYLFGVYKVFGHHPLISRLIQAILAGILMPWLAYRLTRHVFTSAAGPHRFFQHSHVIGLIAAAWVACYGYFVYYVAALITETFYTTGILWALDCAFRIITSGQSSPLSRLGEGSGVRVRRWIELSVAIGVTALLRQAFLLFVPFLFAWFWWVKIQKARQAAGKLGSASLWQVTRGLFIGGVITAFVLALFILPFTAFNYQRFHRLVLLNTNAGYAFFWANHPVHGTRFVTLFTPDMPSYQELIPPELRYLDEAALDQALMKRGFQFVLDDPGRFVLLTLSRIPAQFKFWPLQKSSLPSNLTRVFSFGLALPFMLLGGVLWFLDVHRGYLKMESGSLLVLFICIHTCVYLVSWAGIRYRLPTDAVGLVFAAYPLAWLLGKLFQPFHSYRVSTIGKNG